MKDGGEILGTSEHAQHIREFVGLAAKDHVPVLLLGETGTGKSFLARLIHEKSPRSSGPFVSVDLGTFPASIAHSELFGCRKGAFTGAEERRGLVRASHGGTLFLDEIANAPLDVQACLLQLLDEKTVRALGSERFDFVDCRFIAATRADLKSKIADGCFREDLFFRLRGHVLRLPPLAERGEDVLVVARHWLQKTTRGKVHLSSDAEELMLRHPWPGNFRELFYRLQASLSTCKNGIIEPDHLGLPATDPGFSAAKAHKPQATNHSSVGELVDQLVAEVLAGKAPLAQILEQLESKAVFLAIEQTASLRAAARVLQIPYSSLQAKLKKSIASDR